MGEFRKLTCNSVACQFSIVYVYIFEDNKLQSVLKKYKTYKGRNTTTSWTALTLLVLYFSCFLHTDVVHRLSHGHELQVLHAEKNEKDTCHRSIYHHGKKSCKHKTHLTKSDPCSECQNSAERAKYFNTPQSTVTTVHNNSYQVIITAFFLTDFSIHTSSRAPPVI